MPVPILLAGLSAVAAVTGVGNHMSSKETNKRAELILKNAQNRYEEEKKSLELSQGMAEKDLFKLGNSKKKILEGSMTKFINSYNKVQETTIQKSVGLNELSNFKIEEQDVIQLQQLTNIYSGSVETAAKGVATGTVAALAASGELIYVSNLFGIAGTFLAAGEVEAAAGLAGTALSIGASVTPLAAVAAPVVLFTGISSNRKANENLEKANVMNAEVEVAVEKMKVSKTLCNAISKRSEMFDGILNDLDVMFSECTDKLDQIITKKENEINQEKFNSSDFTEDELKLLAVTCALAGAIKSVIDTPILDENGKLSKKFTSTYRVTKLALPDFKAKVRE